VDGEQVEAQPDPFTWLKFVDWVAEGKIKDYDMVYLLNWRYLCQIMSMKIQKQNEELERNKNGK